MIAAKDMSARPTRFRVVGTYAAMSKPADVTAAIMPRQLLPVVQQPASARCKVRVETCIMSAT